MNKKQAIIGDDWQNAYKWQFQAYPFFTSVYIAASIKKIDSRYSIFFDDAINDFNNGNLTLFKKSGTILKIGRRIIRETLTGNTEYLRDLIKLQNELEQAIKVCHVARRKNTNTLGKWWDDTESALFHTTNLLFSFDYPFDNFLMELSRKRPDDFHFLIHKINDNLPSFMTEAGIYLHQLNKKNTKFDLVFNKFIKKFSWLQNTYCGPSLLTSAWLKKYLRDLKTETSPSLVKKTKITPARDYRNLIKLARTAAIVRDRKKELLLVAIDLMDAWLKDVCRQNKYNYKCLRWLTVDEVKNLVVNKQLSYLNAAAEYEKNHRRFGLMFSPGYIDVSKKTFDAVLSLNNSDGANVLRGVSASPGIYTGRVKIILNAQAGINNFKSGDILVTSMTRPEFLPLMSKAGAFITEEGGISCHAAIVAREMKKPCIIGVKNVTRILKDGDVVQVDAKSGLVTKLVK
ncbi:MAG: PEP-utilizing enzyme [Patescibacteria group bacterium]|jgi:phosphohistidine swiveling domain-containing protein